MKEKKERIIRLAIILTEAALAGGFLYVVRIWVSLPEIRYLLIGLCGGLCLLLLIWNLRQKHNIYRFAEELCEMLDDLTTEKKPTGKFFYEDSLVGKVEGKFLQFYNLMMEERRLSNQEKQVIQELVSDISHQVKTPIANLHIFLDILQSHELSGDKRAQFFSMTEGQLGKLEFLLQSLIKMSRLETGTFTLHIEQRNLYDTIARALNDVWEKAEQKDIRLSVDCDSSLTARHDPKWTAEAVGNILDNAVKYTSPGGSIRVSVRPWQFYTRVDIADTGIGIEQAHYHEVFKRFWRGEAAASREGVGLGLYLAQEIITKQRGYISVKSEPGKGTAFSVYLLS